MANVAIIPARGGSKGIVRKNLIELNGRPLVAWPIEQATSAELVDKVFVSTDDDEIGEVASRYGAEVIVRPAELAADTSSSEDALIHAMDCIENDHDTRIDVVVFLQATSPVREAVDIDNAVRKFIEDKADSLFSCTMIEDYFIWEQEQDGFHSVNYDYRNRRRRQNIKKRYLENGSIYVFKPEVIRKGNNRLGGRISIYEMPQWKSFQVDSLDDLDLCEYYMKAKLSAGVRLND